ncbi:tetratricopeptide repeat protein, partial [Salmonella enterica]|uniref:tetratricopeptide repeat protein n=1 Tax=Salmonella enterica TaxID=28901 RepID=UPI00263DCF27|nr:hypothetical protein [Salmonella enterica subsp. enterica serovar Typhi]
IPRKIIYVIGKNGAAYAAPSYFSRLNDETLYRPELLRQLVSRDHTDIRVLSLYAFSAFEQQRFGEAVAAWEMMLKLLPAGDARRAVIERSIRLAQEK